MINSLAVLESHKSGLETKASIAQNSGIDTTSTYVSIFGSEARKTIRHKAERCKAISNEIASINPETDQDKINSLVSGLNSYMKDLNAVMSIVGETGQNLLGSKNLSANVATEVANTISETHQYGQEAMSSASRSIKDAVSKVSAKPIEAPVVKQQTPITEKNPVIKPQTHTTEKAPVTNQKAENISKNIENVFVNKDLNEALKIKEPSVSVSTVK